MKNSGQGEGDSENQTQVQKPDLFSVNGFRYHRRWAVDVDYLRRLPEAERKWMQRFLSEYYDANNTLLRPEKHVAKCRACRAGGDCGKRPPPEAIHNTDELRRECYRRQMHSYYDSYSAGRVVLWEDFDGVDTAGRVTQRGATGAMDVEALRPRLESGDNVTAGDAPTAQFMRRYRRGR